MTAYAVLNDVYNLGVPQAAVTALSTAQQQAALDAANDEADSYLGGRFRLPLTAWGTSLKLHVCARAAYTMLVVRGYNPDDDADKEIFNRSEQARKWFELIAKGEVTPVVTDSSVMAATDSGGPFAQQMTVSTTLAANPATQLSIGGGPPSVTETAVGFVTVGQPNVRGW